MSYRTIIVFSLLLFSTFQMKAQMSDSLFMAYYGEEQLKDTTTEQRFDYFFYEGLRNFQNRNYLQAIVDFDKCVKIRPTAEVYYELSRVYLRMNDSKRSFEFLKEASTMQPNNNTYQELLANYYIAMKNYPDAMVIFEKLHKKEPASLNYLYQLIGLCEAMNNSKKMLQFLNDLEQLDGLSEEISFERINIYTAQKKLKNVEAELKKLIAKYPSRNYYKVLLGDFYISQDKYERGLEVYESVLKDYPNDGYVLLALSNYYRLQNETEKSDSLILLAMTDRELPFEEKINELRPLMVGLIQTQQDQKVDSIFDDLLFSYGEEPSLRKFHVEYLRSKGDTLGMIEEYKVLLAGDPNDESNWMQLMQLLWTRETYTELLELTKNADAQFKNLEWGYFHVLAMILNEQDDEAVEYIRHLLATYNTGKKFNFGMLYQFLGDKLSRQDSLDAALAAYEKSLEYLPENTGTLNNYAYRLAVNNRELRKAERMASKAIELEPTNASFLDTYAWVFFKRGDFRSAKFYIERALGYEESAVMYDHYGDILYMLNDIDGAVRNWEKAVELGIDSDVIEDKIAKRIYIPSNKEGE